MPHITEFPNLITEQILKCVVFGNTGRFGLIYRDSLQLVGVCRLWRLIGKPIVHHIIVISDPYYRTKGEFSSNYDIIASDNCLGYVKKVNICLRYYKNLEDFLSNHACHFPGSAILANVKCLSLNILNPSPSYEETMPTSYPSKTLKNMSDFCRNLGHCLPNLRDVDIRCCDPATGIINELNRALLESKRTSIASYRSTIPLFFPQSSCFANLTTFKAAIVSDLRGMLPRLNQKVLQRLSLIIVMSFSWDDLFDFGESKETTFDSLTFLELEFPENSQEVIGEPDSDLVFSLHLPRIKTIKLRNRPSNSVYWSTYHCPNNIKRFTLVDSPPCLDIATNIKTKTIDQLLILFQEAFVAEEEEAILQKIDQLASNADRYKALDISLMQINFNIDFQQMNWKNLRQLRIRQIQYSKLVLILKKHTLLERFDVQYCILGSEVENIEKRIPNFQLAIANAKPINKKISFLMIGYFIIEGNSENINIDIIMLLLVLSLPALKTLMFYDNEWENALALQQKYGNMHPHLQNLEIV